MPKYSTKSEKFTLFILYNNNLVVCFLKIFKVSKILYSICWQKEKFDRALPEILPILERYEKATETVIKVRYKRFIEP